MDQITIIRPTINNTIFRVEDKIVKKNISLKNENDENNCNTENEKYSDNYYIDDNNKDKKHSKSNKGKRFI